METLKAHSLRFKALDIDGRASISTDLADGRARGVYAYEFADGKWYVGKSIDVRKRHVQHMHDYRHEKPPRVPKLMLWAEVHGDEAQLDYAESQAISWFERKGRPLLNVSKTGRPRGEMSVTVDTGSGWGVRIPWERENLPASTREFAFEPDEGKLERFQKLQKDPRYGKLRRLLRHYVRETIPAPADTAGSLWTATALPSTSGARRLCTVSCQNAETLAVFEPESPDGEPFGFVNAKKPEGGRLPLWTKRARPGYGALPNAVALHFDSLDEAMRLLRKRTALDACYRANAELMRRGASMYRRFCNPYLVEDILAGI